MKNIIKERIKYIFPKIYFGKKLNAKNNIYFINEEIFKKSMNIFEISKNEILKLGVGKCIQTNNLKNFEYITSIFKETNKIYDDEELVLLLNRENSANSLNKALVNNTNKEVNIIFNENMPVHNRKIVINNLLLTSYSYFLQKESKNNNLKLNFLLDEMNMNNLQELQYQVQMSLATIETRELANTRSNIANPNYLEEYTKDLINSNKSYVKFKKIEGENLKKEGYNLIYNVSKSSKILSLEYIGNQNNKNINVAIIGEGLTNDINGILLKKGNFENTYSNKHAACNVLAVLRLILKLKLKMNIAFIIGLADNPINKNSYKPSEIIISKNGKFIETGNSDGGNLILADCITYAHDNYHPNTILTIGTLCNGCKIGLGNNIAGLFTNDKILENLLISSSK